MNMVIDRFAVDCQFLDYGTIMPVDPITYTGMGFIRQRI